MAKELAFARKASGMVRGVSLLDAFGFGFMNQGAMIGIWLLSAVGLLIFPHGNMVLAVVAATTMVFSVTYSSFGAFLAAPCRERGASTSMTRGSCTPLADSSVDRCGERLSTSIGTNQMHDPNQVGASPGGWAGKVLFVNLSSGTWRTTSTMDYEVEKYVGGVGLSKRVYWDMGCPHPAAYHPDSPLFFSIGPLTLTAIPCGEEAE